VLRAAGFSVSVYEYETLRYVRASLRTPPQLRGCHLGAYLDYFIEGHVSPAGLSRLAMEHPEGLGLVTENAAANARHVNVADDERSLVLLAQADGRLRPWFQPPLSPEEPGRD